MKKFNVDFSNKYEKDFGTRFHTKLVHSPQDELLGTDKKETYYLWGNKQLEGVIELDINLYEVKEETHEYEGETIPSKRIIGLK